MNAEQPIGDGILAEYEDRYLTISTKGGPLSFNKIVIKPHVWEALVAFVKAQQATDLPNVLDNLKALIAMMEAKRTGTRGRLSGDDRREFDEQCRWYNEGVRDAIRVISGEQPRQVRSL